jgi:RHS repeat-associated protein
MTSYQHDGLGNLTQVVLPDGTQVQYVLDGLGRRVGKRVNGALTQAFLYLDGSRPIAELEPDGATVRSRFVHASSRNVPDFMIRSGVTYRIITDHLGSPRAVVDVATGAVAQRMAFDEFGNVIQDTSPGFQPFGFAGGLHDAHTGLVRFGVRDYDPATGRWITKDPIRFAGGSTNLYEYAFGDPVNAKDPSGLFAIRCKCRIRLRGRDRGFSLGFGIQAGPFNLGVGAAAGSFSSSTSSSPAPGVTQTSQTSSVGVGAGIGVGIGPVGIGLPVGAGVTTSESSTLIQPTPEQIAAYEQMIQDALERERERQRSECP